MSILDLPERKSIRLPRYDYSLPGYYAITVCTKNRYCLFGEIKDGGVVLSELGEIAEKCWRAIPEHYPFVELDAFVIMPNHIHGIIFIADHVAAATAVGAGAAAGAQNPEPLPPQRELINRYQKIIPCSLGSIVRGFKLGVTKISREYGYAYNVWQRNYYERILSNEKALENFRNYIIANPQKWEFDRNTI